MAHHRLYPSFFKILLDPSAPHLPLPPDFVRNYLKNKTLKDLIIRSAKGGYSWRLKIKKIGESFCLSSGWESVVQDIQLGFGDFLVFRVLDKSLFKLMVYSPNGCEKDFPAKSHVDSVVVDHDDHIEDVVVEDVGDDDDDDVDDDDDDDEEEDEFEEEDDEDDEGEGYEELEDDGDDVEDDGDGDGDGNGDIDGHDGDPFFMIKIVKSHKTMMVWLNILSSFQFRGE
ncbi:putative transcription factor B3-Domain family [Helianthus annuus]|nr:putative transcription factor B3-Domain family [Helianthus annuus]